MQRDLEQPDGTVLMKLTLEDLIHLEGWADFVVDNHGDTGWLEPAEQELYDRICTARTQLEVNKGVNS